MGPNGCNLIGMGHENHLEELAVGRKVILEVILSMSKLDDKTRTGFV
jgi:hypothetical protein